MIPKRVPPGSILCAVMQHQAVVQDVGLHEALAHEGGQVRLRLQPPQLLCWVLRSGVDYKQAWATTSHSPWQSMMGTLTTLTFMSCRLACMQDT